MHKNTMSYEDQQTSAFIAITRDLTKSTEIIQSFPSPEASIISQLVQQPCSVFDLYRFVNDFVVSVL